MKVAEFDLLSRARALLRKSNTTSFREAGREAAKEGRLDDALVAFRRHLELRPRDSQTWIRLANLLKDAGRYDEAERCYERGCALRPNSAEAWLNRGHLAKLQAREDLAAEFFRRSFALNGDIETGRELMKLSSSPSSAPVSTHLVGSVDGLVANTISGWAVDPDHPEEPAEIEFLQNGTRVGSGKTSIARPDVAACGFQSTHAGFRVMLSEAYRADRGRVVARLARSGAELSNSPYQPDEDDSISKWLDR